MGNDKREKIKDAVPIGQIITKLLQTGRRAEDGATARVWQVWDDAVGGFIAENARPAAIKGKVLLVYVNSSPWLHQLRFLKSEMVDKLNRALGERLVEDIKFKIGPVK
jgi:predicted nucleic acid-binding Zn ribbon protein